MFGGAARVSGLECGEEAADDGCGEGAAEAVFGVGDEAGEGDVALVADKPGVGLGRVGVSVFGGAGFAINGEAGLGGKDGCGAGW